MTIRPALGPGKGGFHNLRTPTRGVQWRNDGVAAASSDGGPTGGRGLRQFYFIFNQRGGALTKENDGGRRMVALRLLYRDNETVVN